MPPPSPEVVVENLRRTLRSNLAHYAALGREALSGELEDELVELSFVLGLEWPGSGSAEERHAYRQRLGALLDGLCAAAREDRQAAHERPAGAAAQAAPPVTTAIDRWLERWLSGKESGRLP
jgi:hypothetical protein